MPSPTKSKTKGPGARPALGSRCEDAAGAAEGADPPVSEGVAVVATGEERREHPSASTAATSTPPSPLNPRDLPGPVTREAVVHPWAPVHGGSTEARYHARP
jgi:hypothetical protein